MIETELVRKIMLAASRVGSRLFRNNVGMAWIGRTFIPRVKTEITLYPGDVVIRNARPFHGGLCTGSSDLIGWTVVKIRTEMLGQNLAVFTAVEAKTTKGRATREQLSFIEAVKNAGGIAFVARDEREAERILSECRGTELRGTE